MKKSRNFESANIAADVMLPQYALDYRKKSRSKRFTAKIVKDIQNAQEEFEQGLCRPASLEELIAEILS